MEENDIYSKIERYFAQQEQKGVWGGGFGIKHTEIRNLKPETQNPKLKDSSPTSSSKSGVVVDAELDMFVEQPKWKMTGSLDELFGLIHNCTNCSLGFTRKNFVFGSGNPKADIMVIGEAPGADEDEQGLPFVGRAGQLLTKILEAINLKREDVYICNILKCRPPQNRTPVPQEVEQCEPYLKKQIELIKPAFILVLGLTAVDTLLGTKNTLGEIRGKVLNYHGIKMLVTYHPAALLRNPHWKKETWEDVKLLRKLYDEYLKSDK